MFRVHCTEPNMFTGGCSKSKLVKVLVCYCTMYSGIKKLYIIFDNRWTTIDIVSLSAGIITQQSSRMSHIFACSMDSSYSSLFGRKPSGTPIMILLTLRILGEYQRHEGLTTLLLALYNTFSATVAPPSSPL
jgi:hypothetical protein